MLFHFSIFSSANRRVNRKGLIAVPVKNSLTGEIRANIRRVREDDFRKFDELIIPVIHCIGSRNSQIDFLASHPEVFKQCADYLHRAFPDYPRVEVESTDRAASLASENKGLAAIANPETCLHYGLKIIRRNIVKNSFSTFWILCR
jgi:chorismate mutase/prephenate dehydratase